MENQENRPLEDEIITRGTGNLFADLGCLGERIQELGIRADAVHGHLDGQQEAKGVTSLLHLFPPVIHCWQARNVPR